MLLTPKSSEESANSFGCFVSLGCCFLFREDSVDFVPSAALHTAVVSDLHAEISLHEKTVKSSPVCDSAFSRSWISLADALDSHCFVDGKVSGEFTFMDTSEVSVIVRGSEISTSVDGADVSLLGEFWTSSRVIFPNSSEFVNIPSRCNSRWSATENVHDEKSWHNGCARVSSSDTRDTLSVVPDQQQSLFHRLFISLKVYYLAPIYSRSFLLWFLQASSALCTWF